MDKWIDGIQSIIIPTLSVPLLKMGVIYFVVSFTKLLALLNYFQTNRATWLTMKSVW